MLDTKWADSLSATAKFSGNAVARRNAHNWMHGESKCRANHQSGNGFGKPTTRLNEFLEIGRNLKARATEFTTGTPETQNQST